MKTGMIFTLVCFVVGCKPLPVEYAGITTMLSIADTTGTPSATFHPGESFDLSFSLTNQSGADQSYHFTGVPVVFQILQGDSVVATSVDGLLFAQVVLGGGVRNGETFRASWRAPNTLGRDPKVVLPVGQYSANVLHGCFFDQYTVPPTTQIPFAVIPLPR